MDIKGKRALVTGSASGIARATALMLAERGAADIALVDIDVAVRKPGNVSLASAGHRMQADMFLASAQAAVGPLFAPGERVGDRIEGAMAATWAAVLKPALRATPTWPWWASSRGAPPTSWCPCTLAHRCMPWTRSRSSRTTRSTRSSRERPTVRSSSR